MPKPLRMIIDSLPMELKLLKAVALLGIQMGFIDAANFAEEKKCSVNIRKLLKEVSYHVAYRVDSSCGHHPE